MSGFKSHTLHDNKSGYRLIDDPIILKHIILSDNNVSLISVDSDSVYVFNPLISISKDSTQFGYILMSNSELSALSLDYLLLDFPEKKFYICKTPNINLDDFSKKSWFLYETAD